MKSWENKRNFNSIKVQLELLVLFPSSRWWGNFNSIKVQLELIIFCFFCYSCQFQFHKGTIRTREAAYECAQMVNFNSIKVQLELIALNSSGSPPLSFQFHKGTIRTLPAFLSEGLRCYFNSIKVQLEQKYRKQGTARLLNFNSIKVQLEQHILHAWEIAPEFQFHKGTIRTLGYSL